MQIKAIEIRDRHTCIPAAVIRMTAANEVQRRLMARVGFHGEGIVLMRLCDQEAHSDPYSWRNDSRTMPAAHIWLEEHFDQVTEGDVIDVEFVLGETTAAKAPEWDRNP